MKKLLIILCVILISCFVVIGYYNYKLNIINNNFEEILNNYKAYELLYNKSRDENKEFILTINQLKYSNDSIVNKLNEVRKQNKILDKEVKRLSLIKAETNIKDSLAIRDSVITIHEPLDTSLSTKWYTIGLALIPPSNIGIDINIPSEKTILVSNKKETIDPPKKCWLGRIFQKKHIVTDVKVIESNPYIVTTQTRFIEVK